MVYIVTAGTGRTGKWNKERREQDIAGRNEIFLDVSKGVLRWTEWTMVIALTYISRKKQTKVDRWYRQNIKVKYVKVKFIIEQATKAQRGEEI
jgi:hypothetical protein